MGKLAGYSHLGVLHTLCALSAGDAIALSSVILDRVQSVMEDVAAAFVHPFAGRADAEALVGADGEVSRLEDDLPVEALGDFFFESLLMSVRLGKPRVTVAKLVVGNIGVDPVLDDELHVFLRVETGIS